MNSYEKFCNLSSVRTLTDRVLSDRLQVPMDRLMIHDLGQYESLALASHHWALAMRCYYEQSYIIKTMNLRHEDKEIGKWTVGNALDEVAFAALIHMGLFRLDSTE